MPSCHLVSLCFCVMSTCTSNILLENWCHWLDEPYLTQEQHALDMEQMGRSCSVWVTPVLVHCEQVETWRDGLQLLWLCWITLLLRSYKVLHDLKEELKSLYLYGTVDFFSAVSLFQFYMSCIITGGLNWNMDHHFLIIKARGVHCCLSHNGRRTLQQQVAVQHQMRQPKKPLKTTAYQLRGYTPVQGLLIPGLKLLYSPWMHEADDA